VQESIPIGKSKSNNFAPTIRTDQAPAKGTALVARNDESTLDFLIRFLQMATLNQKSNINLRMAITANQNNNPVVIPKPNRIRGLYVP
jgi:hypothetical protein